MGKGKRDEGSLRVGCSLLFRRTAPGNSIGGGQNCQKKLTCPDNILHIVCVLSLFAHFVLDFQNPTTKLTPLRPAGLLGTSSFCTG